MKEKERLAHPSVLLGIRIPSCAARTGKTPSPFTVIGSTACTATWSWPVML